MGVQSILLCTALVVVTDIVAGNLGFIVRDTFMRDVICRYPFLQFHIPNILLIHEDSLNTCRSPGFSARRRNHFLVQRLYKLCNAFHFATCLHINCFLIKKELLYSNVKDSIFILPRINPISNHNDFSK